MSDLHEAAQEQELVIRETVRFLRKQANWWAIGNGDDHAIVREYRNRADELERVCGLGENTKPQPPPVKNDLPAVWDLVVRDMAARDAEGLRKYGTRLQPHNGRDALVDGYQEALDLCVYLRQALAERDGR